jgi:hypothetical protein
MELSRHNDGTATASSLQYPTHQVIVELNQRQIRVALHGLVLLHEIAEKYSCDGLGGLVATYFERLIPYLRLRQREDAAESKQTAELVEFIYKHAASPLDPELPTVMTRRCIYQAKSDQGIDPLIERVVKHCEPVAWFVGIHFADEASQQRKATCKPGGAPSKGSSQVS